jgi:hypothetical protein
VRGHLAAQIDPLGLNNMDREQARKMIIRSVTVDEKVKENENQNVLVSYFLKILCLFPHSYNLYNFLKCIFHAIYLTGRVQPPGKL